VIFTDRIEAGRALGRSLAQFRGPDTIVVGLPRGGVPVAAEVARALGAPLDVLIVRKVGVPFQPELAMGAIGENGVRVVSREVLDAAKVTTPEFATVERRERLELERRAARYRAETPALDLRGKTVILVDDGLATGSSARAACEVARAHDAAQIVLAIPVAPGESLAQLREVADSVVCLQTPTPFGAVGQFYEDFSAVSDEEVMALLRQARSPQPGGADPGSSSMDPPCIDRDVALDLDGLVLDGHLTVPAHAIGVVAFAHGSGSSRFSTRNRLVAGTLNRAGLATLLFDLLTRDEEVDRRNVFDVELLAGRLGAATRWLRRQPELAGLPIGYFGASTGAAAALWAAAEPGNEVAAVVSRGGRPDLAGPRLGAVLAPTLLIVGGRDDVVIGLNEEARALLTCEHRLIIVPGATHLFEETGTLDEVASLATDWFSWGFSRLGSAAPRRAGGVAPPSR